MVFAEWRGGPVYEAVSGLLEIFSAMFQGYCLQYFIGSFGTFVKLAAIMFTILVVVLLCYRGREKLTVFLIGAFMAVNEISFFLSYMIFKLEDKLFRFPTSKVQQRSISEQRILR